MADLTTLMAQKKALEAEIAAQKPAAVAQVVELMQALGVTWEDMGVEPIARRRAAPAAAKRRIKYRDANGNTWTGVGQRPRWVVHALAQGATLEQFAVKEV